MQKRLFFLKKDGWCEAVPGSYLHNASYDELIKLAYGMMTRYCYRNYMITENPCFTVKRNGCINSGRATANEKVMDYVP